MIFQNFMQAHTSICGCCGAAVVADLVQLHAVNKGITLLMLNKDINTAKDLVEKSAPPANGEYDLAYIPMDNHTLVMKLRRIP
jgi:hypothetical protein